MRAEIGDRVSYEDMANPRQRGTVTDKLVGFSSSDYRITWDEGGESWSDLRQSGWRSEDDPAPAQVIQATPASGPGALAGFRYVCRCGLELKSSLRTALELDISTHERWHAGTDRGMLAPIPGPKGAAR